MPEINSVKVFSYWESSPYSDCIPPYVLCGIASMKRALGDRFTLLTPNNLHQHIEFDFSKKLFFFARSPDRKKDSISQITAKADFIRFRFIQENGGFWLDADTLVLDDFTHVIDELMFEGKFVWHSVAMFGAYAGNLIASKTAQVMIDSHRQRFANPGDINGILNECSEDEIATIPRWILDPTLDRSYKNIDWVKLIREDVEPADFITNSSCKIIKMYNSNLLGVDVSEMSLEQFFESNTLMSKLFLHVEPSTDYWVNAASELRESLVLNCV